MISMSVSWVHILAVRLVLMLSGVTHAPASLAIVSQVMNEHVLVSLTSPSRLILNLSLIVTIIIVDRYQ